MITPLQKQKNRKKIYEPIELIYFFYEKIDEILKLRYSIYVFYKRCNMVQNFIYSIFMWCMSNRRHD